MSRDPVDVMPPRILIVDDERQIHASVRLRLGRECELVSCFDAREALERIRHERFDLCFADIHMPHMDGLTFIERARETDPALGYVVLSAFDTEHNLRRAIPLQVFEFIGKPLPEREGFERRIPEWVERTRRQRRDQQLVEHSHSVAQDLASAQLAQEVELVASETARDALLQTANLLTTIHAHLVSATALLAPRAKTDTTLSHFVRSLEEARRTADAAVSVAEGFFNSAYASRDSSPAFVASGLRHAIDIVRRLSSADEQNKAVDLAPCDDALVARDLSGVDFLLMMTPVVAIAIAAAAPGSTIRIAASPLSRLEAPLKDSATKSLLWLNRKNALLSQPGVQLTLVASAPALDRAEVETWLNGASTRFRHVAPRGLIAGLQKSRAIFGLAVAPATPDFRLVLALPA